LSAVRQLLVGLAAVAALGSAAPAAASTPLPWCGTGASEIDRIPDATPGFAVHVAYVRPPGGTDRLAEWAPQIVGDVAAIDAWWRVQDPSRAPRFDLYPFACASLFGQLDISNVTLQQPAGQIGTAFTTLRFLLAEQGFIEPEKTYLFYYDGPLEQQRADSEVCGVGGSPAGGLPGIAIVFLDSCVAEENTFRPIVAIHELVHTLGAVSGSAPHHCSDGHVCDVPNDLLNASLSGSELEAHVLDGGRDDYYGHQGSWADVQDSLFLERLDSPDRSAPSSPAGLTATDGSAQGVVRLSWRPATDDVGPVTYRIYQDNRFVSATTSAWTLASIAESDTSTYAIRAADSVGHLSQPVAIRFRLGFGVVDARGTLIRDTVRPPALGRVSVRRATKTVRLFWPATRDGGGIRGYRIKLGTRVLTVTRPGVTLNRATLRTAVSVAAVDRAGNIGPSTTVPLSRLR
jgi:hypothetical protein